MEIDPISAHDQNRARAALDRMTARREVMAAEGIGFSLEDLLVLRDEGRR